MIEQTLTVDFEGRCATFDWGEADQLSLAYVVSVHKAQGSEFPVVVMPVVTQHYTMLQRNLLYTSITRARELCVLVGSRRAIGMAVKNNKVAQRHTALEWRLGKDAKLYPMRKQVTVGTQRWDLKRSFLIIVAIQIVPLPSPLMFDITT